MTEEGRRGGEGRGGKGTRLGFLLGLVEETKTAVETEGFYQMITEATRFSPGKQDSCIDHVWTNSPHRIIRKWNIYRGTSDHNIIGIYYRIKGVKENSTEFMSRNWNKFNKENYVQKL